MASTTPTTFYGFSNVDISKQIIVTPNIVLAGISRANQTISIYHGETLIADCTMPSTGIEDIPTVVLGEPTLHDETFTDFVEGETYTIVAGDEPPITGFATNRVLFSFDPSALWCVLANTDRGSIYSTDNTNTSTNYTISQKITTTKKRYDIKRLPEELLPKTAATKAEVRKVQTSANSAMNAAETAKTTAETAKTTAETAKTTAETAKTTAKTAKTTAETAQTTAETAKSTAETAQTTAENTFWGLEPTITINTFISDGETATLYGGCHLIVGEQYFTGRGGAPSPTDPVWDGKAITIGKATIKWDVQKGVYHISGAGQNYQINGRFINQPSSSNSGATLPPYIVFPGIVIASRSDNSTKKFKITVDDSGEISATEVV